MRQSVARPVASPLPRHLFVFRTVLAPHSGKGYQRVSMFEHIEFAILSFGTLFAIVNPATTVPTFLTITEANTTAERLHMARLACSVALGIFLLFSVVGLPLLGVFQISIPAFQIAGGLIILRIAMDNLHARRSGIRLNAIEQEAAVEKDNIAITPLAVPVLAGPAGITTVILLSEQAIDVTRFVLAGVILLICLVVFVSLRLAAVYSAVFGEITMRLIIRIMGLLLAAIAVQIILSGLQAAWPA